MSLLERFRRKRLDDQQNLIVELETITADFDSEINIKIGNMSAFLRGLGYGKSAVDDFVLTANKCVEKSRAKGKPDDAICKYIELDFNKRKNAFLKDIKEKNLSVDKISENLSESLTVILANSNYAYLRGMVDTALIELDFDEKHGYPIDFNRRLSLFIQGLEALGYGKKFIAQFKTKIKGIIEEEKKKGTPKDNIVCLITREYNKAKLRNFSLANTYIKYLEEELNNYPDAEKPQMREIIMDEIRHMLSLTDKDLLKYYEKKDALANVEIGTHREYFKVVN